MRTMESWLAEYSESHQNLTNQKLHKICVPAIFFSILGMLWALKLGEINAAIVVAVIIMPFYVRLGGMALAIILPQLAVTFAILFFADKYVTELGIFSACLGIFVIAWIGQFYGHKVEGKRPSFFKDMQFLLIGPLWVLKSKQSDQSTKN